MHLEVRPPKMPGSGIVAGCERILASKHASRQDVTLSLF